MGTKNNPATYDCYAKAEPDEPMFVLLARDSAAPGLVREWAQRRRRAGTISMEQYTEAFGCAKAMEAWRRVHR
jgi:hypothetical protein